jgi:hypothetical protein
MPPKVHLRLYSSVHQIFRLEEFGAEPIGVNRVYVAFLVAALSRLVPGYGRSVEVSGRSAGGRTISTEHFACRATNSETLPSSNLSIPRLP